MRLRRGGNLHFIGTYLGVRLRESTFTTERALAERLMLQRMAEVKEAYQGRGKPRKATYGEANAGRLAEGGHSAGTIKECKKWLDLIGPNTLCEAADWAMVRAKAETVLRPGFKPATLKRTVAEAKATLTWASEHYGLQRGCPAPRFPSLEDGEPRKIYVPPQYCRAMHVRLLELGEQVVADALCIAVCEGARRGELHGMTFAFVDFVRRIITFRGTKSKGVDQVRDRVVSDPRPWSMETLLAIRARRGTGEDAVFVQPNGERFASKESFGQFVNKRLRRVAQEVGFQDWAELSLHVLRHTAATNHYLLTRDIHEVGERFDWWDTKSAKRYVQKTPKQHGPEAAALYGLDRILP